MLERHESFNKDRLAKVLNYQPQAFLREENMALPMINAKTAALLWVWEVSVCFIINHTNSDIKYLGMSLGRGVWASV